MQRTLHEWHMQDVNHDIVGSQISPQFTTITRGNTSCNFLQVE